MIKFKSLNVHLILGKTLIAAESIMLDLQNQAVKPVLFLVPTRQLVQQQATSLERETGLVISQLRGGSKISPGFEVSENFGN